MIKSVVLEVVGEQRMRCEGCQERVEDMLRELSGVRKVRADARKQRVEVLFDTSQVEPAAFVDRLRAAGYETRSAA